MDYIKINNFMINGERRVKRNEIIDVYNNNLNELCNNEEKTTQSLSTEMTTYNEENTCRYCLEGETFDNELISPCLCNGTQKYIHLKCLQTWRKINKNDPEKRDYCELCNHHYSIKKIRDVSTYKISVYITDWFLYFPKLNTLTLSEFFIILPERSTILLLIIEPIESTFFEILPKVFPLLSITSIFSYSSTCFFIISNVAIVSACES